jgi:hypothetical protein
MQDSVFILGGGGIGCVCCSLVFISCNVLNTGLCVSTFVSFML